MIEARPTTMRSARTTAMQIDDQVLRRHARQKTEIHVAARRLPTGTKRRIRDCRAESSETRPLACTLQSQYARSVRITATTVATMISRSSIGDQSRMYSRSNNTRASMCSTRAVSPAATAHLRQSRDARQDLVANHVPFDQLAVFLVVRDRMWAGSYEAHGSLQYVNELRQLVERPAPQMLVRSGVTR